MTNEHTHRNTVRDRYANIAQQDATCCGPTHEDAHQKGLALGYDEEDLQNDLAEANLGLGCGNPTAITNLQPGETVIDLGSGAGFDCFLAADHVEDQGRVIGVDMTPEMIDKARNNKNKLNATNVQFRLGEIEHLPIPDQTADVIISNCVINLSPDKPRVYQEAHRVLTPGGRIAISDIIATNPPPDPTDSDATSLGSCTQNAATAEEHEAYLQKAAFENIHIEIDEESRSFIRDWDPEEDLSQHLIAARIQATKPKR